MTNGKYYDMLERIMETDIPKTREQINLIEYWIEVNTKRELFKDLRAANLVSEKEYKDVLIRLTEASHTAKWSDDEKKKLLNIEETEGA